jgi:hypothetical protein
MAKYTSGRQKNLKIGISSYSEDLTSLEVIGRVGVGTTNVGGNSLYVVGDGKFTGTVTAGYFSGDGSGLTNLSNVIVSTSVAYASTSGSSGYATTAGVSTSVIGGIASVTQLYVSTGITTVGFITASNLYVSGVSTLTQISVGGTVGSAGSILSSTGTGLAWISAATNNATYAGYATTAGISTNATYAGYATTAGIATNSTYAGYATTAGIATNSTYAGYATTAGVSTSVIGGIASVTQLYVSTGITTVGFITASNLYVSGVSTLTQISVGGSTGKNGQYLKSTESGLSWSDLSINVPTSVAYATTAGIATNIVGGSAGAILYQYAIGITSFTQVGTAGSILVSDGSNPPYWGNINSGGGINGITIKEEGGSPLASNITTLDFYGSNITASVPSPGIASITVTNNNITSVAYATTAGIATNSTYAGYASTAGIATNSTYAGYATTAGIATNSTYAGYASTAGISTNATYAGYATTAGIATNSTYAGYASTAGISTNATYAGYATTAGISTNATYAGYATTAGIATNSTYAGYATTAGISTNATYAGYATTAGVSTSVIGGIASVTQLYVSTGITTVGFITASNLYVSGISTFLNGRVSIGTETSTGTANQILQVSGGAYFSGIGTGVGIGTTNPTTKLDVNGDFRLRAGLYDVNNMVGSAGYVLVSTGAGVSWTTITGAGGASISITNNPLNTAPNYLLFTNSTGGSVSSQNVSSNKLIYIDNPGYLGIGTTNPQGTLQVGTAITMYGNSGIISAFKYYGDGSNLSGTIPNTITNIDVNATYYPLLSQNTSGTISSISVSSNSIVFNPGPNYLGIGSTGTQATLQVGTGITMSNGIVTATSFFGSGSNLSGIITSIVAGANITTSTSSGIVTISLDLLEAILFT